jgi:hypothetical protein
MKPLLILLCCISLHSTAQQVDSTAIKIEQLRASMIFVREQLNESHHQFKSGLMVGVLGFAASCSAIPLNSPEVLIFGGVLQLMGGLIMLDSHKYIGRAGRWEYYGNGVRYHLP